MLEKVGLSEKFSSFSAHWEPKIVGEVNDAFVKVVKISGAFVWHRHETEDEMFLVYRGRMVMRFRDRDVTVMPGEFIIVPRGVEHQPTAAEETEIVLFEPKTVLNTGNVVGERTVSVLERI
jgi:mannose-6-phosphate isomerase-like protein (cupin superfamily)